MHGLNILPKKFQMPFTGGRGFKFQVYSSKKNLMSTFYHGAENACIITGHYQLFKAVGLSSLLVVLVIIERDSWSLTAPSEQLCDLQEPLK